jgi:cellulose synthase/poly-beta-1,6-N-acetylglucosamine synthase-like glycosyltransferase
MTMTATGFLLILSAAALFAYTYVGYPLLLALLAVARRAPVGPPLPISDEEWPLISITVPVYNEERQVRGLIEQLLGLDYPAGRRQILLVSDASSDGTDTIVREYADAGVELLRMPERRGKTAAENAARARLRGEIVINTDASVRIDRNALKPLVSHFGDPRVGLASGRDMSMASGGDTANSGESGYVGYEMWIRRLETRAGGIVGASGCFYAIRSELHGTPLPDHLSRDFAAALVTREKGYRAVSVDDAICYVPRTHSLHREYGRKVRTITRGIGTLWHKRNLLNPLRYPLFAWMLWSHKVCRWLVPWTLVAGLAGLLMLAPSSPWALGLATGAVLGGAVAAAAFRVSDRIVLPRLLDMLAAVLAANAAAIHAGWRAATGTQNPTWEPTRRDAVVA